VGCAVGGFEAYEEADEGRTEYKFDAWRVRGSYYNYAKVAESLYKK